MSGKNNAVQVRNASAAYNSERIGLSVQLNRLCGMPVQTRKAGRFPAFLLVNIRRTRVRCASVVVSEP